MSDSANHRELRPDATGAESSADELFDVFREERRRIALSILAERRSPMGIESLARSVADVEFDRPCDAAVEDVRVTLHHVHLPKLSSASLIDYDREASRVEMPGPAVAGTSTDGRE